MYGLYHTMKRIESMKYYKVIVITKSLPDYERAQEIYIMIQRELSLKPFTGELMRLESTDTFNSKYYDAHYPNSLTYAERLQNILRRILPDSLILVELLYCGESEYILLYSLPV